jgi:uncharacterized membrane protein YqaE (UPF0057 family)
MAATPYVSGPGASAQESRIASALLLGIAAVLLPPLAVAIKRGVFTPSFWLCVLLTLIGWLPGQVYALYVVCVKPPLGCEAAA